MLYLWQTKKTYNVILSTIDICTYALISVQILKSWHEIFDKKSFYQFHIDKEIYKTIFYLQHIFKVLP